VLLYRDFDNLTVNSTPQKFATVVNVFRLHPENTFWAKEFSSATFPLPRVIKALHTLILKVAPLFMI
jgi:hypothetical protein